MSAEATPGTPTRVGDALLAHLRAVVDQPDVSGSRYTLVAPAGRGGMGTVWRALDRHLEREVALKVIDEPDAALAHELAARLVQEAKVLARLEHPSIVPVHDVGLLADGRAYYAMKLVIGKRLDELVDGGLSHAERLRIFARIGEAVAFAHARGVIHLDLKPANIMVGPFGEVLVLDWGLARAGATTSDPAPGMRAGTDGYMAPEQQAGLSADARTDVFALGRVLAQLGLAGREVTAIVARATATRPEERYASVIDLTADVARFQAGERVEALPEGWLTWVGRSYRKYKAAVWLVGAYAVLRLGFELVRLWIGNRNS